ncbi:hypothetical protein ABMA28_001370 [Loxostege sticticalis]|uniref:FLYWCH-type domain-containing protein n=1 Tax=Loxostege sticticalis TaxID=481309 RepID=A0ABD0T1J5_LOXSC
MRGLKLSLLVPTHMTWMKQGNLLLYKGYTFSKHCTTRAGTTRWKCSRQVRRRCKAHFFMSPEGVILRENNDHNHEPSRRKPRES